MTASGPVGVGLIGAGMISDTYLENLTRFPDVDVRIVADREVDRAKARAQKHGVARWGNTEDVLADPDVELVVNLTIPAAHAEVSARAVAAGKNVWSEKPISIDRDSGRALLKQADQAGLLVGVAPDTVLGRGVQAARRAIARGDIGQPLSAQTSIQYAGPDLFHPNPQFLFSKGAGPLYDVGPYYMTALVQIFGPISWVAAVGSRGRATRTVRVGDKSGTSFDVEVSTHVSAIASYAHGGVSQSVFSFDSPLARSGVVEITGTEGTLVVPDPNEFDGTVKITRAPATVEALLEGDPQWEYVPVTGPLAGRGTGVLDLARAIRTKARPLASGELAYHVLDALIAMDEAAQTGQAVRLDSSAAPVPLLDEAWDPYAATL